MFYDLSFCSYSIGDIVDTLSEFCESQEEDPKQTFVWICCFCVNQHRVVQQSQSQQSGMLEEAIDFFTIFAQRVVTIGHVLCLMSPWNYP
jgi:hypothetical protein